MSGALAFTWWGHASTTVELGGVRVAIDPLFSDRLFHLTRYGAAPTSEAWKADVVLVSHLHHDHFHVPSLGRFPRTATLVVPSGSESLVSSLGFSRVIGATPGDTLELTAGPGLRVEILPATHDDRRLPLSSHRGPPIGFRMEAAGRTCWFPGDTDLRDDMREVRAVDLALVPVGGWGPGLGTGHMDHLKAVEAVVRVGANWAVPVHWGTFWPTGLPRLGPRSYLSEFVGPGPAFVMALSRQDQSTHTVLATHGHRVELIPADDA